MVTGGRGDEADAKGLVPLARPRRRRQRRIRRLPTRQLLPSVLPLHTDESCTYDPTVSRNDKITKLSSKKTHANLHDPKDNLLLMQHWGED